MGTNDNKQYNPMDHIQVADTSPRCGPVLDQRDITIQSYQTDIPFDYERIDAGLDNAWLSPALALGVIERQPRISDDACGVVLGLQGRVSVRVYDYDRRRPLWFNWMNAVVETISIRYFKDENGLLRFTTTGGGRRINDEKLEDFHRRYLGIQQGAVTKRRFDLDRLRSLCFGEFVDRLYMVRFAGPSVEEYKSIDHALFQSKNYIDPDSGRLKEMRLDAKVKIELFESAVALRSLDLSDEIQVRFLIKGSSGSLRLRLPRLPLIQQPDTVQEQAAVFYRVVDKAVNAILDESYYTSTVLLLADLDTEMEMFPDMVDLAPYRKVLKAGKNRQAYFDSLDLGGDWKTWLPHLRAIDELVEAEAIAEDVSKTLRVKATSDPLKMARLIAVCRDDAKARRVGELAVRATANELYGLPADVRGTVEGELLTWALKHETEAWRVDPAAGEVCVYNLRWTPNDLTLERLHEALILLVEQLHKRLRAPRSSDICESLLRQMNWCLTTAKVFSANYESLHAAFRLVVEDKVPRSVDDGAKLFRELASDWADLDRLTHEQYRLPLWPSFEAARKGKSVTLKNAGLGAALSASAVPAGAVVSDDGMPPIGDLPPGCETTLTVPGKATALEIRYLKFGEKRTVTIPIRIEAAAGPQTSVTTDTAIETKTFYVVNSRFRVEGDFSKVTALQTKDPVWGLQPFTRMVIKVLVQDCNRGGLTSDEIYDRAKKAFEAEYPESLERERGYEMIPKRASPIQYLRVQRDGQKRPHPLYDELLISGQKPAVYSFDGKVVQCEED